MKSKIKVFILIFTMFGFLFNACNKSEDLVTEDVKTGGLVLPSGSIPYKLGATPVVPISLAIPMGPGIASVKVMNQYIKLSDTTSSNVVLMKTVDISNANSSEKVAKDYTITFTDLIKDLLIEGVALPTDETQLAIGDYWILTYISVMQDGREVLNNATTKIAVANIYAGAYQCVGVFHHPTAGDRPINEEKFLTPLSAYSCSIPAGDLGSSGYSVTITVDPETNDVSFSNGVPTDFFASPERSYYDPANGHFYLHYFYVGGTGNRVIDEEYTPL